MIYCYRGRCAFEGSRYGLSCTGMILPERLLEHLTRDLCRLGTLLLECTRVRVDSLLREVTPEDRNDRVLYSMQFNQLV